MSAEKWINKLVNEWGEEEKEEDSQWDNYRQVISDNFT